MSIGAIGSEAGYYGYGSARKSSEANDVMPTKATQAEMYAFLNITIRLMEQRTVMKSLWHICVKNWIHTSEMNWGAWIL